MRAPDPSPPSVRIVSALGPDSLRTLGLGGHDDVRSVGRSTWRFARGLRSARAGKARLLALLPSGAPRLVVLAALARCDRIAVYHAGAEAPSGLETPALRAAFALVDLTIVDGAEGERAATMVGADPNRVMRAGGDWRGRLLGEPPRADRRRAAAEAIASLALDAADLAGLLRLAERLTPDRGVNVVNYHRILPVDEVIAYGRPQMALAAPVFEAQLALMAERRGFAPIADVYRREAEGKVAITFDDGYEDNYRVALPILQRFSTPACIFVVTNLIGRPEALWWDKLGLALFAYWRGGARLPIPAALPAQASALRSAAGFDEVRSVISELISELNGASQAHRDEAVRAALSLVPELQVGRTMLTWDEVTAMAQAGVQFGGHTRNHVPLDELPREVAREELFGSHADLAAHLRDVPRGAAQAKAACLPRGRLGALTEADILAGGLESVMTTEPGVNRADRRSVFVRRRDGRMLTLNGRHHPAKLRLELTGLVDRLRSAVASRDDGDYDASDRG